MINYPSIATFQQFVELKDCRPATRKEYVRYVRKLAEHFQCDPATLTEDQLREYFLFLREHKRYKAAPMKAAKFSIRCFLRDHLKLGRDWSAFRALRIVQKRHFSTLRSGSGARWTHRKPVLSSQLKAQTRKAIRRRV